MHQLPLTSAEEDVVGLDVSDGIVSVARVGIRRDGTVRLRSAGWTDCPAGASNRELAAAMRRVWSSSQIFSRTVAVAFRSPSVVLRYFKYPALNYEEFESALRIEAEESLQLAEKHIVLDWHVNESAGLAPLGATGNRPREGLLAAAPRKEVERYLEAVRMAGLYPVVVDLEPAALGNVFRALYHEPEARGDTCVVHLTSHHADIAVLFQKSGIFARTIAARSGSWESSLDYLAEGVGEVLRFHEFKLRRERVGGLFITGRIPPVPDFVQRIESQARVPVRIWDPLSLVVPASRRVRNLLRHHETVPSSMVISLGLALRRYDDA